MKQRMLAIILCMSMILGLTGCAELTKKILASSEEKASDGIGDMTSNTTAETMDDIESILDTDEINAEKLVVDDATYITEPTAEEIVFYDGIEYVDGEIILHAELDTDRAKVVDLISGFDGEIVGEIAGISTYQIRFRNSYTYQELKDLSEKLEKNEYVVRCSLNLVFEEEADYYPESDEKWSSEWNDGNPSGLNWGVEAIYAPEAWDYRDQMKDVNVGVYDCCFDKHNDLKYIGLYNNHPEWCSTPHGTHVAGIIGAKFDNGVGISGVAPSANLYCFSSIRFDQKKYSYLLKYELAIYSLVVNDNCKVINFSQNTGRERCYAASNGAQSAINSIQAEADEIEWLLSILLSMDYDFVICVAAGNVNGCRFVKSEKETYGYSTTEDKNVPLSTNALAEYNNFLSYIETDRIKKRIIVVGACGNNKDGTYTYSSFSNIGKRVDVVAPGEDIYSTVNKNDYKEAEGTSMATPHVSGIAAMLFALDDTLTGEEVKRIIIDTATTEVKGCNYKMVNARDAVRRVIPVDNNNLVTDAYNEKFGGRKYAIPYINLNGEDIDQVNAEIWDNLYNNVVTNALDMWEEYGYEGDGHITYQWTIQEGILSLLIESYISEYTTWWDYYIYNVDIATGRVLSDEEVLSRVGFTKEDYYERAKDVLGSYFWGDTKYFENYLIDDFFKEQLRKTISQQNLEETSVYIDEKGHLCIVGKVYSMAGADSYWHALDAIDFSFVPDYAAALDE